MLRAALRIHLYAFARGPGVLLFVLTVIAGVVFAPNGLNPHDLPKMLPPGSLARAALVTSLVVLSRASVRRVMMPPGAVYVRASPLGRAFQLAIVAALALAAQLPIPIAFAVGGAPFDALVMVCVLAGASVASTALEAAIVVAMGVWAGPLALAAFPLVLWRAFRDAPVRARASAKLRLPPFYALQLFAVHVRAITRDGLVRVVASLASPFVGLFLVRAVHESERFERARSLAATVAVLSAAPLMACVGGTVRALRPVVRASPRSRLAPLLVGAAIVAMPSMAFAAGTHVVAHQASLGGIALVPVLVVLEGWLVARRRDARLWWALCAIPLAAIWTAFSRVEWALVAAGFGSLAVREPEVSRADDR